MHTHSVVDNALQPEQDLKISPDDIWNYHCLTNQAALLQTYYGKVMQDFVELVEQWNSHQESVRRSSNSEDYINHSSYERLVELGNENPESTIPLIMEKYACHRDGWWHEPLHVIVCGQRSDTHVFSSRELFRGWKDLYKGRTKGKLAAMMSRTVSVDNED